MDEISGVQGVWGAFASIVVGLFVFLGTRYTAKSTRRAQETASEAEQDATAITGYATLVADIQKDRVDMRERLDRQDEKIKNQDRKIGDLEKRVEKFQRLYQNAIKYIVLLRRVIVTELPGYTIPEPPEGLMMDIDGGHN